MAATAELATFTWEGLDKKGNKKSGETTGPSEAQVKAELRRRGINPTKVKKKSGRRVGKKITTKDIAVFMRQLATMMSAGVPLVQSFEIVGNGSENPRMGQLLLTIKGDVEAGNTLAEAMSKHKEYFDELVCNLVDAGEQAGTLEELLDKIATYKEKVEAIKGKIKKALFYPVAVIVVAFVITAVLMIFVIPQFAELFKGFGADLPALTQFVINLSNFFVDYWIIIFGAIAGLIFALSHQMKNNKSFQDGMDRLMLKIPVIGALLNKAAVARFARTMSTMFAAGMPLVDSLETVGRAAGNIVYEEKIIAMKDEVATGNQLNASMKDSGIFPSMVVQMVAIGEETGAIDTMLSKVADFYEEEVDNAVDGLTSLLEPLIMAFLGVVIGGLVIAMYLPIFKMGEIVGGNAT